MNNLKVSILKSKHDLYFNFDNQNNNVILITGISSSGKSTLAKEYSKESSINKVSLDLAFFHEKSELTELEKKIVAHFKKQNAEWEPEIFLQRKQENQSIFYQYANLFFDFIINNYITDDITMVLEGVQCFKYIDINKIANNKIIIKRTSLLKCMIRKFKRTIPNFKNDNKLFIKKFLLIIKISVINQYIWYKKINKFIMDIYNRKIEEGNLYER